jgi:hypothetical protein
LTVTFTSPPLLEIATVKEVFAVAPFSVTCCDCPASSDPLAGTA